MQHTQRNNQGYFQNLGISVRGLFLGFILFCASTYGLYWNETRVNLFDLASESIQYSQENLEQKLISYTGIIKTTDSISDNEYISPIFDIVALNRMVEMYSWQEESHTENEHTTYSYKKVWSSSPENSSNFHHSRGHSNPSPRVATGNKTYKVNNLTIGEFNLEPNKLKIETSKSLILNDSNVKREYEIRANYIYMGLGYGTLTDTKIGDIRVGYRYFPAKIETTTFGLVELTTIEPYKIENSDFVSNSNGGLYRLFEGDRTQALKELKTEENLILWIVRILSVIFMYIAFNTLFEPINAIFNIFKLNLITSMATNAISAILTLIIAIIAILFGKLANFYGFYGAIIVIVGAVFIVVKFVFTPKEA